MSVFDKYFGIFTERTNDQVMRQRAQDVFQATLEGLRSVKASEMKARTNGDVGVILNLAQLLGDESLKNLDLAITVASEKNQKMASGGQRTASFRSYPSGRGMIEILVFLPPEAQKIVTQASWPGVVVKQGAKIFERTKESFIHEFIHYMDWSRVHPDKRKAVMGKDLSTPEKYYNNPLETNAYLQQGLSRVDDHLRGMSSRAEAQNLIGKSPDEFYRIMLKVLNPGIGKYMNAQNKNKLKKRLAGMWSDTMERFDK